MVGLVKAVNLAIWAYTQLAYIPETQGTIHTLEESKCDPDLY